MITIQVNVSNSDPYLFGLYNFSLFLFSRYKLDY